MNTAFNPMGNNKLLDLFFSKTAYRLELLKMNYFRDLYDLFIYTILMSSFREKKNPECSNYP